MLWPGFTSISMYPRMWQVTGVDYATLVDELVAGGLLEEGSHAELLRNENGYYRKLYELQYADS